MSDVPAVTAFAAPTFGRKSLLVVRRDDKGLDLSAFRHTFKVNQMDSETPNTAEITIYNLKDETVAKIRGEFDSVVLQAGYEKGAFGTVFAGTIKQFGIGRENSRDSFLTLFCADGDIGYNFGLVASTLAAGSTMRDAIDTAAKAFKEGGVEPRPIIPPALGAGQTYIRGKVLWGLARSIMRDAARSLDAAWSIQDGEVRLTPLTGYAPGEAVVLTSATGLIGVPQLTNDGVSMRCLMNPRIRVGGLVSIDNKLINQVVQQNPSDIRRFNSFTAPSPLAKINADGLYTALVVEHDGDSRGGQWYTDLVCLAVQSDTGKVLAYG